MRDGVQVCMISTVIVITMEEIWYGRIRDGIRYRVEIIVCPWITRTAATLRLILHFILAWGHPHLRLRATLRISTRSLIIIIDKVPRPHSLPSLRPTPATLFYLPVLLSPLLVASTAPPAPSITVHNSYHPPSHQRERQEHLIHLVLVSILFHLYHSLRHLERLSVPTKRRWTFHSRRALAARRRSEEVENRGCRDRPY